VTNMLRYARAIMTNQFARYAPSLYVRATRQTGRGARDQETADDVARYFSQCVDDYFSVLGLDRPSGSKFLSGKVVLEYGPGDLPGVALLLVALGAQKVYCVDRFPMFTLTDKNIGVINALRTPLNAQAQQRLAHCFTKTGRPASGLRQECIEYVVRPNGLSGLREKVDIVISRAVLEHVNDLPALFSDMVTAMRAGALSVHQVDLRSHGLHRSNPLDFLSLSPQLWQLMYSEKGVPNRFRIDAYRAILQSLPVTLIKMETTARARMHEITEVRPTLAAAFKNLSDDDLSVLGFWILFKKVIGVEAAA
jgi:hypothetical protein